MKAILIMNLTLSDDVTVSPDTHVAHWTGDFPHCANGEKLIALLDEGAGKSPLSDSLPPVFQFSAKPDGGLYRDYQHKVTTYIEILGREARQLDPSATAQQWKVTIDHEDDENVFHFADTASARQNTTDLARKLLPERVAIVGAGGTGLLCPRSCGEDMGAGNPCVRRRPVSPAQRLPFAWVLFPKGNRRRSDQGDPSCRQVRVHTQGHRRPRDIHRRHQRRAAGRLRHGFSLHGRPSDQKRRSWKSAWPTTPYSLMSAWDCIAPAVRSLGPSE